ncbi:MAG: hypothetical protein H6822_13380 [Planctomycetaceae bacterium]|nr:hypothetical protein [Planctomycetales bacterium]MCB9923168.1 hypothetical protein [Planctomycetaceae bacterium]
MTKMAKQTAVPADSQQRPNASTWNLLRRIHRDEEGAVSIETILIIAAIAIPILIFIIKFGWPRIKAWFNQGMQELEGGMDDAAGA